VFLTFSHLLSITGHVRKHVTRSRSRSRTRSRTRQLDHRRDPTREAFHVDTIIVVECHEPARAAIHAATLAVVNFAVLTASRVTVLTALALAAIVAPVAAEDTPLPRPARHRRVLEPHVASHERDELLHDRQAVAAALNAAEHRGAAARPPL